MTLTVTNVHIIKQLKLLTIQGLYSKILKYMYDTLLSVNREMVFGFARNDNDAARTNRGEKLSDDKKSFHDFRIARFLFLYTFFIVHF